MSEHKYMELANKLRTNIQSGAYRNGQKLPSENELAASTGYSRQTVRQAISILEREGFALRIQGSGTYVRSIRPRRADTYNIGVVTTYIGEYIFPAILEGIDEVLSENGYTSMLSATRNRLDNERRILTELLQKPIDGLLVEGTKTGLPNPNIDLYNRFAQSGIPVIFMNSYYADLQNPLYVVANDQEGGSIACQLLLKKGHKHIAGIFKSDDMQGLRRYAGFTQVLCGAGLPVTDDHILWYTTENRSSLLAAEAARIVQGCTAVVCYNDEAALEIIQALQKEGLPLPGRVEIVSFDNSTLAQLSPVPFLSLSNPKEALGRIAAKKLLNVLHGATETPAILPWCTVPQQTFRQPGVSD